MIFTTDKTRCTPGHDCCHPDNMETSACPRCGETAKIVPAVTLETLLKPEAKAALETLEGFHFCKTPTCGVVYFHGDIILWEDDLTIPVGIKEGTVPATLCYCFGWTKEMIKEELKERGETTALDDIKTKMKDPGCACEIRNPSGRCCLADVAGALKEYNNGENPR